MPHGQEKRRGIERRQRQQANAIERRTSSEERRQTSISEISYFEWASHFVKFQGRTLSEKPDNTEANTRPPEAP